MLFCSYFLSDPPDSLSVMHIDPNPACPSVFTKSTRSDGSAASVQTSITQQSSSDRKTNLTKHISFELIMLVERIYHFVDMAPVVYTCALPEHYSYLFYEEINPPPPGRC